MHFALSLSCLVITVLLLFANSAQTLNFPSEFSLNPTQHDFLLLNETIDTLSIANFPEFLRSFTIKNCTILNGIQLANATAFQNLVFELRDSTVAIIGASWPTFSGSAIFRINNCTFLSSSATPFGFVPGSALFIRLRNIYINSSTSSSNANVSIQILDNKFLVVDTLPSEFYNPANVNSASSTRTNINRFVMIEFGSSSLRRGPSTTPFPLHSLLFEKNQVDTMFVIPRWILITFNVPVKGFCSSFVSCSNTASQITSRISLSDNVFLSRSLTQPNFTTDSSTMIQFEIPYRNYYEASPQTDAPPPSDFYALRIDNNQFFWPDGEVCSLNFATISDFACDNFHIISLSGNTFSSLQSKSAYLPQGSTGSAAVGLNMQGYYVNNVQQLLVNNNRMNVNGGLAFTIANYEVYNITNLKNIQVINNSLSSTHYIGVRIFNLRVRFMYNLDSFFADNNSAFAVLDQLSPTRLERERETEMIRINDFQSLPWDEAIVFLPIGFVNVGTVIIKNTFAEISHAGYANIISVSARWENVKQIHLLNNRANLTLESTAPIVPPRNAGDVSSTFTGVLKVGDLFENVDLVVAEGNVGYIRFQYNFDLMGVRIYVKSAKQWKGVTNSSNLKLAIIRNNNISVEKTAYGFGNDQFAAGVGFAAQETIFNNFGTIEISHNNVYFIARDLCGFSSCSGIFFTFNSFQMNGVKLVNVSNNNVTILSEKGGGAHGILFFLGSGVLPDFVAAAMSTTKTAIFAPGLLQNLESFVVRNNIMVSSDPEYASGIAFSLTGTLQVTDSVQIENNRIEVNTAGILATTQRTGIIQIGCPYGRLLLNPLAPITFDCETSVFNVKNSFSLVNVTSEGSNGFLNSKASFNANRVLIRNVTWNSDLRNIQQYQFFKQFFSGIFLNFARWASQIQNLVIDNSAAKVVGVCTQTSEQIVQDIYKRVVPSQRVGFARFPMVSSSNFNVFVGNSSTFDLTCLDSASTPLSSRRFVDVFFFGNLIETVRIDVNNKTNFKISSPSAAANNNRVSEAIQVNLFSVDFSQLTDSSTSNIPASTAPLQFYSNVSDDVKITTTGSQLDALLAASDGKSRFETSSSQQTRQRLLQTSTILDSTLRCVRWNDEYILRASKSTSTRNCFGDVVVDSCPGHRVSATESNTDPSVSDSHMETQTQRPTPTHTETIKPAIPDLGLPARVVDDLESAAIISTAIASAIASNPSALLAAVRGSALMRMALCKMVSSTFNIPEKEAFLQNFSISQLKAQLPFPKTLVPTFNLGAEIGAAFRAAILVNILVVIALIAGTLYFATVSKENWRRLVLKSTTYSSKDIVAVVVVVDGGDKNKDAFANNNFSKVDEDDKQEVLFTATKQHAKELKKEILLKKQKEVKAIQKQLDRDELELNTMRGKQQKEKILIGKGVGGERNDDTKESNKKKRKDKNKPMTAIDAIIEQDKLKKQQQLQKKLQQSEVQEGEVKNLTHLETSIVTMNDNNDKKQQTEQEQEQENNSKSSPESEAVAEMSLFRFWSIDRILLKIIILILPNWCELAGGLAAVAPAGFGDRLLGILPILIIALFSVGCAVYIWQIISSYQGTFSHDPLLKVEKKILATTQNSSLSQRKKIIQEKRQIEAEEMMSPMKRRKLEKKREKERAEKEKERAQQQQQDELRRRFQEMQRRQFSRENINDDDDDYNDGNQRQFDGIDDDKNEQFDDRNSNFSHHRQQISTKSKKIGFYRRDEDRYSEFDDKTHTAAISSKIHNNNLNNIKHRESNYSSSLDDPLYFTEQSELYFPLGASSQFQRFCHRTLQHWISRFWLVGNETWFNPYFLLSNCVVVPAPGVFTQFPYVFSTYKGPLKRPPQKAAVDAEKKNLNLKQKKTKKNKERTNNKQQSGNNNNNNNNDENEEYFLNEEGQFFEDEQLEDEEEMDDTESSYSHAKSTASSTFSTTASSIFEQEENRLIFESTLGQRISTIWIFISVVATIICLTFVGAAKIQPEGCYGAFIVTVCTTLPIFLGSVLFRPYLIPGRNLALVVLESSNIFGAILFLAVLLNPNDPGEFRKIIAAAQLFSTVPASILGPTLTILGLARAFFLYIGRSRVVTRTKLRKHFPKELDLAEARLLRKMDHQKMDPHKKKSKRIFGFDASWFFDE